MKRKRSKAAMMADYIISENATIRETAKQFGCGKTSAHQKITSLRENDPALYGKVREILDRNFEAKSSRGGKATWDKYHQTPRDKAPSGKPGKEGTA